MIGWIWDWREFFEIGIAGTLLMIVCKYLWKDENKNDDKSKDKDKKAE